MRYALRRVGFFVLTLWTCVTLNFLLPRMMPGNPAIAMLARFHGRLNPASLKAIEIAFGVNTHQSLWSQYVSYLHDLLTLNFGTSITFFPASVSSVIKSAIPYTLGLVGITTILAFLLGTLIGMVMILVFGLKLQWFPYTFSYDPTLTPSFSWPFISSVIDHAILPAVAILITSVGAWILT